MRNGGSLKRLLMGYVSHLGKNIPAYEILTELVIARALAILCFERGHTGCHRQVLAAKLEAEGFRVGQFRSTHVDSEFVVSLLAFDGALSGFLRLRWPAA